MFKRSQFFILLLIFILIGCDNASIETPIPSTHANYKVEISNNGITPATVSFINQSVNATGYLWKFGNGDSIYTTSLDTIFYTYNTSGTYNTSLRVESANNDLYYNKLFIEKSIVINSSPVKRLYFTDRVENKVKYIVLDNNPNPVIEEFESATLDKPYGMDMDTINGKLYVTDYGKQVMNSYKWNGSEQNIIMNTSTSGFSSPLGVKVIGNKIYWGQPGGIYRANLDGTSSQLYISISGEYPQDIAFDQVNNTFYFTNDFDPESGGVWKVNFDGSGLTEIVPDIWGGAIEVDPENNRLYFYAGYEGMYISDLNGNNRVLFDSSVASKWTWGMAIDKESGRIYYPNRVEMTIMRANLDGSECGNIYSFDGKYQPKCDDN
ncbi:MAG: hypothetical protein MZV70_36595 [Desulfobacterales bacterium]|nr:hypothetical protein [Desulfobacterales bacterium]